MNRQKLRNATRLTLQSVVSAMACYYLMDKAGLPEVFIGVLSAALVIQPTVSSVMKEAWNRLMAILVGSAIGLAVFMLAPGHTGSMAALGASIFAVSMVAGFRPEWRYGIVAAVALSLGSENQAWQIATDRGLAIAFGMTVGVASSFLVWPESGGKRTERHVRAALDAIASRLDIAISRAKGDESSDDQEYINKYHENISAAMGTAEDMWFRSADAQLERIEATEKAYNSILIVNRVAEEWEQNDQADSRFHEAVHEMRTIACEMITAFSRGEVPGEDELDSFWSRLEELREWAAGNSVRPREHVMQNALVFGLGEIGDSLRDLLEATIKREKAA